MIDVKERHSDKELAAILSAAIDDLISGAINHDKALAIMAMVQAAIAINRALP